VAAALILIVVLAVLHQLRGPVFSVGRPLPSGKVKPQLVSDADTAVLLAPDGSLWAWGGKESRLSYLFPHPKLSQIPLRLTADSNWLQVAGGGKVTLALKNDGSLWAWKRSSDGQSVQTSLTAHYSVPTRIGTETDWIQISVAGDHRVALKSDGSLWTWGENDPTRIGQDRDWRNIAAGQFATYALKTNGTLWGWGAVIGDLGRIGDPRQLDPDTNWLTISAHSYTLMALKTDGTLWLTPGQPLVSSKFSQYGQDRDWAEVYPGTFASFARKKDGGWWGMGLNIGGQLGFGTNSFRRTTLQPLPFGFEPWAFAPGQFTTLLLTKDGKLWTWGARLGLEKTSRMGRKIEDFFWPVAGRFRPLRAFYDRGFDLKPHLLWELPPDVRRSLGIEPNSATNNFAN